MKLTAKQRFDLKVRITPGCWIWTASKVRGYGSFRVDGKTTKAHRFSYAHHIGNVPDDLFVCHRCDVPACVNPDHLFLGTNLDNMRDKVMKGRQSRTSIRNTGGLKLPREVVDAVKAAHQTGMSTRAIAAKFGMANSHVWNIAKGNKRVHF